MKAEQRILSNMVKRQSLLIIQPGAPKNNELIFGQYANESVDLGLQTGNGLLATGTNHHLFSLVNKANI